MKKNSRIVTMAAAALLAVAPVAAGVVPGATSVNTVQAAAKGNDFVLQPTGKPEFSADATTVFSVNNRQFGNGAVLPLNISYDGFTTVQQFVNAIKKANIKIQSSTSGNNASQQVRDVVPSAEWVAQQLTSNGAKVSDYKAGDEAAAAKATVSNLPAYLNFTLKAGNVTVTLPLSNDGKTTAADVNVPQINVTTQTGSATASTKAATNGQTYYIAAGSTFNPLSFTTSTGEKVSFSAQQTKNNSIYARIAATSNSVNTAEAGHYYPVTLTATNDMGKTATLSYTVMVVSSGAITLPTDAATYAIYGNNPVATGNTLKAGTKIYVGSTTQTINNVSYTKISTTSKADADSSTNNVWVKTADLSKPSTPAQDTDTATHTVMVDSRAYDKNGNYLGHMYYAYDDISIVPKVVTINGKTYYKVANKDEYVRVTNITGTKRRLRHNAYIYWSSYRRTPGTGKMYRGDTVITYGGQMRFKNGKKYYRIEGCRNNNKRYIKAVNFYPLG